MPDANVIVLNGTSSAGKTTLAKAIQFVSVEPYQILAFDQFRDGLPDRYRGLNSPEGSTGSLGLNVVAASHEEKTRTFIQIGSHMQAIMRSLHCSVLRFVESGQNVILDHFVNNAETADNLMDTLTPVNSLFVEVVCEQEELLNRERKRPGRFPGTAETQRSLMNGCLKYDLTVDSTHTSPIDLARHVLQCVNGSHNVRES